ncbi:uncharacterized protein LOC107266203 isoform X2 [Cephus cinctus]|uniref:Uncharacterized protein LOC107266203 isoform X2 n=1 Tax=Cephus cinctus TaxID=211228 RepID=A0AAJ7BQI8_CEPCN|nr:uncharacterized protein LOC107266203 isoform X2 [Cephus cinctus]
MNSVKFKKEFLDWVFLWASKETPKDPEDVNQIELEKLLFRIGYNFQVDNNNSKKKMLDCNSDHFISGMIQMYSPPDLKYGEELQNEIMNNNTFHEIQDDVSIAIKELLNAIIQLAKGELENSTMRTPAIGIIVTTPDAPDIPKMFPVSPDNNRKMPSRYRSLDTLTASTSKGDSHDFPDPGQLTPKSETQMDVGNEDANTKSSEKKFISRSSPAVNSDALQRSDTFTMDNKITYDWKLREPFMNNKDVLQNLYEIQNITANTISLLHGDSMTSTGSESSTLKAFEETIRPIRRLSAIGHIPGLSRVSNVVRSIPRPKIRRSITMGAPITPTSSKSSSGNTRGSASNKKLISTSSLQPSSKRREISPNEPKDRRENSLVSSGFSSFSSNTSPSLSSTLVGVKKNPKYAHIQSTIPKTKSVPSKK